ncbi:TnsD family Tn7-like transposition protein [Turicibacter sanguinis]|uniref:TnsD family Tn7-like transposition protein n=1 Tax=Turicibacter sanguinis TaxID=154288 RepID=UPI0021D51493|nr:TnsD family Tn7-like transposition protein [Turicibacter sanguinis]MCU7192172.1 TnsD family transposase [Turicibacter sanguinis]
MILNFPKIYEDELFYSIVARYRNLNGIRLDCDLRSELGLPNRFKSHALLNYSILSIIDSLPNGIFISHEQIIEKNTIYPYLNCLLHSKDSDLLKQNFLKSNSDCMINKRIINRRVGFNEFLKFCPVCLKEQQQELGECYFKCIWQVPGVLICNKHDVFLLNSNIRVSNNEGYQYFNLNDESLVNIGDKEIIRMNKCYCELVEALFNGLHLEIDYILISNFVRYQLEEHGYINKAGKVNRELLVEDFVRYYGLNYLNEINCNPLKHNSWLYQIYSNRKDWCVLHHLLILQYFECTIQDVINFNTSVGRFCNDIKINTNNLQDCILTDPKGEIEYHQRLVLKAISKKDSFDLKQIEQIASQSIKYLKEMDDDWINQILSDSISIMENDKMKHRLNWINLLLEHPDEGRKQLAKYKNKTYKYLLIHDTEWFNKISPSKRFKEINRVYYLHYNAVVEYVKNNPNCTRHSLKAFNPTAYKFMVKHYKSWMFKTIPISRKKMDDTLILKHREKLKSKLKGESNVTRTELISMLPSTYKYLKKNDKEWLETILPKKVRKPPVTKEVDWTDQNSKYIEQCNLAIHRIKLCDTKPTRITRKKILIEVGLGNLIYSKKSSKYQMLFAYLDTKVESVDEFRKRKIRWAIEELLRQDNSLSKTNIYKMCSIRKFEKSIDDFIEKIIEEKMQLLADD